MSEVGGERSECVFAHTLAGEVFQGLDVAVGEELGEAAARVDRQDGGERGELQGAAGFEVLPERRLPIVVPPTRGASGRDWLRLRYLFAYSMVTTMRRGLAL
jgi:hypothetical protein